MKTAFLRILVFAVTATTFLSGCATAVGGSEQWVNVKAECKRHVFQSRCTASNDKGVWRFETPSTLLIPRSSKPLFINCDGGLFEGALDSVSAQPSVGLLGNALFGGLLGVAVDIGNETAFAYPSRINIELPLCKLL